MAFFKTCPALLIGLLLLLGSAMHIAWHPIYLALLALVLISLRKKKAGIYCALLVLCAYGLAAIRLPRLDVPSSGIEGSGRFAVRNVTTCQTAFQRFTMYEGVLHDFTCTSGATLPSLRCAIFLPFPYHPKPADHDYAIQGTLVQKRPWQFALKPKARTAWQPVARTLRIAQWRCDAKRALGAFIAQRVENPKAAHFLRALLTGDVDERTLKLDLNRLGLSHLLAVSGFHFALIALFLDALLRLLLPFRARLLTTLSLLSCYCFFLGYAPSILRAYVAIALFLVGKLCGKQISGCNALGVGLCAELLIDPLIIMRLSFQLSFLSTLAILLLYRPMNALLGRVLAKRPPDVLDAMPLLHLHGYLLLSWVRKALALNLAVHAFSVPVLLCLFHKFSLCSIAYNLFIPPLAAMACICLLLALLTGPLNFLFFWLSEAILNFLLVLTSHAPAALQFPVRTRAFSFPLTLSILVGLCVYGIWFWGRETKIKTNHREH